MKTKFNTLIRSAAMAALITSTATFALGAEPPAGRSPAAASATAPAAPARAYPFRGTVGTADPAAQTVSLAGRKTTRILQVDANTKLSRDGKDIAVADLQTGDYLKGLVIKNGGQETLVKASVGEKPVPQPRATRAPRRSAKTAVIETPALSQ